MPQSMPLPLDSSRNPGLNLRCPVLIALVPSTMLETIHAMGSSLGPDAMLQLPPGFT